MEFTAALRLELATAGDDQKALRKVARKLITMAERGDMSAIREIADRIEGKVAQASIIQGDEDGGAVRYIVMPEKSATTEEWLESIRREDAERSLVNGVAAAVDHEPPH